MGYKNILFSGLTLLFLVACHKPSEENGVLISFASTAQSALVSTKAGAGENTVLSTTETMRSKPFGIYGLYAQDPGSETGKNVFLSTDAVSVSYRTNSWEYDNLAFNVLNSSSVDLISIDYKVASGTEDLMFAFWKGQANEAVISRRVPMSFTHALAGLSFSIGFRDSKDVDDSRTDNITSFAVSGIIPNGTVLYTHPDGDYDAAKMIWIAENYDASTKYYQWTGSKPFYKLGAHTATPIFDGQDHVVMAIPQSSSGAKGPTKVFFTTSEGGEAVNEITLPPVQWEPGVIYKYTFIVSQSKIDVDITIKDWEPVEINEDIHIL